MNSNLSNGGASPQSDSAPRLFEMFFDMHHPAASLQCQRARMVKPPEGHEDRLCAEICKPSFITNILCYAFPDFYLERDGRKFEGNERLNRFDVYIQGFSTQHHTFTLRGSSGYVLYGHVLRYLSPNPDVIGRPDVGRRETRAMVLLTRAGGGERFFHAILKTLEACMAQSAVDNRLINSGNAVAEKAIHFLHSVYRAHLTKNAELILRIQRGELVNHFDDNFMIISGIEWTPSPSELRRDKIVRGGWVTFRLPNSLQPGYKPGIAPDDIDSPILPLIRSLCPENILSVLSALLCERRIIFISSDATKLSACVHAAAAMLAQGCLTWVDVFFPILPPHMLKCLSSQTPYLVGVLDIFIDSIQGIGGLTDVLRVDLDKDELRTYNMINPASKVPDISNGNKKQSKPTADASSVGDVLLAEIDEIQRTERRIWGGGVAVHTATEDKNKVYSDVRKEDGTGARWGMLGSSKRSLMADNAQDAKTAPTFGPTRGWMGPGQKPIWRHPKKQVTAFDVCDNDRGEEHIRRALLVFFLALHGDLAILLSENRASGKLEVDLRKYLLSKKRQGVLEDSPIFHFYRTFCTTGLLAQHIDYRLAEVEGHYSVLLPHHQPLFMTCAKALVSHRMPFTVDNIGRVVSKALAGHPWHALADHHENVRAVALELTASHDADGDVLKQLRSLISSSYECDGALGQVISVVWSRLDDAKAKVKQHLLALHLLKILLQNGPITTLSIVTDGFNKIRALKRYSLGKSNENREIQESAAEVCELLINHNLLFLRRKHTLSNFTQHDDVLRRTGWGSYLIRRLPITVGFQRFHEMLAVPKPPPMSDDSDACKSDSTEQSPDKLKRSSVNDGSSRSQESVADSSRGIQKKIPNWDSSSHSQIKNIVDGFSPGEIARTLQRARNGMAVSKSSRSLSKSSVSSAAAAADGVKKGREDELKSGDGDRQQGGGGGLERGVSTKSNQSPGSAMGSQSDPSSNAHKIPSLVDEREQKMRVFHRNAMSEGDLGLRLLNVNESAHTKDRSDDTVTKERPTSSKKLPSMFGDDSEETPAGSEESSPDGKHRVRRVTAISSLHHHYGAKHNDESSRSLPAPRRGSDPDDIRRNANKEYTTVRSSSSVPGVPSKKSGYEEKKRQQQRRTRRGSDHDDAHSTNNEDTTLQEHSLRQLHAVRQMSIKSSSSGMSKTNNNNGFVEKGKHQQQQPVEVVEEEEERQKQQQLHSPLSSFLDSEVVIRSKKGSSRVSYMMEESGQDSFSTLGFTEPVDHNIQTQAAA